MPGRIFINYRRGDQPGFAGRLYDRLEQALPGARLFMDVDNIPAGADFVEHLDNQVGACDVLLAVIGDGWLSARDADGHRRIDKDDDFVTIEIASALKKGKHVIPVLIGSTPMPAEADLPPPLKALARRNAVRVTHERFRSDVDGLVRALKSALEEARRAEDAASGSTRRRHREVGLSLIWFGAATLLPWLWSRLWSLVNAWAPPSAADLWPWFLTSPGYAAANAIPGVAALFLIAFKGRRLPWPAFAIYAVIVMLSAWNVVFWLWPFLLQDYAFARTTFAAALVAGACAAAWAWKNGKGWSPRYRRIAGGSALVAVALLIAVALRIPYAIVALEAFAIALGIAIRRMDVA